MKHQLSGDGLLTLPEKLCLSVVTCCMGVHTWTIELNTSKTYSLFTWVLSMWLMSLCAIIEWQLRVSEFLGMTWERQITACTAISTLSLAWSPLVFHCPWYMYCIHHAILANAVCHVYFKASQCSMSLTAVKCVWLAFTSVVLISFQFCIVFVMACLGVWDTLCSVSS